VTHQGRKKEQESKKAEDLRTAKNKKKAPLIKAQKKTVVTSGTTLRRSSCRARSQKETVDEHRRSFSKGALISTEEKGKGEP